MPLNIPTFAGYDDVSLLGEGGLGKVYKARRMSTGGFVAIKELRDLPAASPAWHRARREVEAMLRVKGHPNVVSVEEILDTADGPCIVMEYAEGGSLIDRVERGPLSAAQVVLVGLHVAQALAAAHSAGVVHRDIKPHNLLVSSYGHVKVADFGIAAIARQAGLNTRTQSFTLAYASPEELDGVEAVGPSTDSYSLAATLVHLLTGRRPSFRNRAPGVLPFDSMPELRFVGEAIRRCLLVDPRQRPTAEELVQTFEKGQLALGPARLSDLNTPADVDATVVRPVRLPPPPPPAPLQSGDAPTVVRSTGEAVVRPLATARGEPPAPPARSPIAPRRRARHVPLSIAAALVVFALIIGALFAIRGQSSDTAEQRTGSTGTGPPSAEPTTAMAPSTTGGVPTSSDMSTPAAPVAASSTDVGNVVAEPQSPVATTREAAPTYPVVAALSSPRGVAAFDGSSVIVTDDHHLLRVPAGGDGGVADVLAGSSFPGEVNSPEGVAVAPDGTIVWADWGTNRIKALSTDGTIAVVAGNGSEGYSGDGGPATEASLHGPVGVTVMPDGSVVFADNHNHVLRRINPQGIITTIAGTGIAGRGADGPALGSALTNPQGVHALPDGSILFTDTFNHRVRLLSPDGVVTTIAGTGEKGSGGDGGAALSAQFSFPVGIGVLADGSVAIADWGNDRVRVISPQGIITSLADWFDEPQDVAVLADGSLLVTDTKHSQVWRRDSDGWQPVLG